MSPKTRVCCFSKKTQSQGDAERITLTATSEEGVSASATLAGTFGVANKPEQAREQLHDLLCQLGTPIYHSTPSAFRHLVGGLPGGRTLARVRLVVFGGGGPRPDDLRLYRAHFARECWLVNGLGSTESSQALQGLLDHDAPLDRALLPVGHAIEGTEVVLLDAQGRETDGWGELAIRSDHVALGYWNDPQRTAAVFSPGPPMPGLSSGAWLSDQSDATLATLIGFGSAAHGSTPITVTEVRHAGGAIAHVDPHINAFSHRAAPHVLQLVAATPTREAQAAFRQQVSQLRQTLQPHVTGGVYPNFLEGEESLARSRDGFSTEARRRLQELKAKYDPDNRFNRSYDLAIDNAGAPDA